LNILWKEQQNDCSVKMSVNDTNNKIENKKQQHWEVQ